MDGLTIVTKFKGFDLRPPGSPTGDLLYQAARLVGRVRRTEGQRIRLRREGGLQANR
jgi:hypothetical protein